MPRRMRSGPRPRYVWVPGRVEDVALGAGLIQTADMIAVYATDALREVGPGMVIERILGSLTIASQDPGMGGQFTMGISLVSEGGWAATPNPELEIVDWLVWLSGDYSRNTIESSPGTFTPVAKNYQFDVRARRRIRAIGDEVRGVLQNPTSETLAIFSLQTRTLIRVT